MGGPGPAGRGRPGGLLERRLLFVTGKGGVGKTTVAAALALLGARAGRRTLVCEVDAKGDLADSLEAGVIGFEPRPVAGNLFAMAMDTEGSLKEYLSLQLRLPLITRIGPLARTFDFLATAAPGVREVLTVGKLAWEVREGHFDLVVADASAAGHIVGQLEAPQAINDLVSVGLIRQQTSWMTEMLTHAATTGVVMVAAAEEMAVAETLDVMARLGPTRVDVAGVVVNRVLPELFGRAEEEVFERLRSPEGIEALAASGRGAPSLLEAAGLAVRLRRSRAGHLARLREGVGAAAPILYVPELFSRTHGLRATHQVADALAAEIG